MLFVDARVGPSKIHGLGLIAREHIPRGTVVWRLQPGFDVMLTPEAFEKLSASAQWAVRHYAYFDSTKQVYVLSADDDRFVNHSDDPNTDIDGPDMAYASRDIAAGEEITWNYRGWKDWDFLEPDWTDARTECGGDH